MQIVRMNVLILAVLSNKIFGLQIAPPGWVYVKKVISLHDCKKISCMQTFLELTYGLMLFFNHVI